MENKKYYITTAIAYASGKPHIGNTYEIVLADAIARFKRLEGYNVYFQTGTDEHGQKIEDRAKECNLTPNEFANQNSNEIKRIWDLMNATYDKFVKTTNVEHEKVVQAVFKKLYDQGDIYLGNYEGLYCKPCESFWTESQLKDDKCPDCGRDVQVAHEEAYFLKISKYQQQLVEYINSHNDFIQPLSRKNEMLNTFLNSLMTDLCVTRTSFTWGIPVPFNNKHVIYVWIDALLNYITFIGYNPNQENDEFQKMWPADLQIIGKDILRFHTIYWPIILMALGIELPNKIFAHPWLLTGNDKMSKSKGNTLYADDLVKKYGVDAIRYFVLHETPFANDGNITEDLIVERTNSDLVNVLGNLVNRTITMAQKYFNGTVKNTHCNENVDNDLLNTQKQLYQNVKDAMNNIEVGKAIEEIISFLRKTNKYVDITEPWKLFKDANFSRLETVIYNLLNAIRISTILLQPYIPSTCEAIFKQLNIFDYSIQSMKKECVYSVLVPQIIYKRIETNKN